MKHMQIPLSFCQNSFEVVCIGITSFLPILELRGGIILAMALGYSSWQALLISLPGNLLVAPFFLLVFPRAVESLLAFPSFHGKITRYFEKMHKKHSLRFNRYGALFLAIFVFVPLPGSGAWTGALLAYLFNIPFRLAVTAISAGVLGAGILMAFLGEGFMRFFIL